MMVAAGPSSFFITSLFQRRRRECSKGEGRRRRFGTSLVDIDSAVLLSLPPVDVMGKSDSTSESLTDLDLAASYDLALEAAVAEAEAECPGCAPVDVPPHGRCCALALHGVAPMDLPTVRREAGPAVAASVDTSPGLTWSTVAIPTRSIQGRPVWRGSRTFLSCVQPPSRCDGD
jgi:hypothetical protein